MPCHIDPSYWVIYRYFAKLMHLIIEMDTLPSQTTALKKKTKSWFTKKFFPHRCVHLDTGAWGEKQHLSANAMKDCRNFLSRRSLSRGSLGSITWAGSLCNSSPLSGIPRARPIVSNSWGSLFLKLICESRGCELDIEKKASTRILDWKEVLASIHELKTMIT